MKIVSIGTDSEFFLFDKDGNFVPAYYITEGTKELHEVINVHNGVAVHWDNVALEVTCPPLFLKDIPPISYRGRIQSYLDMIHTTVVDWVHGKGLVLSYSPVVEIPEHVMYEDQANIFGCDPDYNIYTLKKNPSPSPMKAGLLRTAGAHFHFGLEVIDDNTVAGVVQRMDKEVGKLMLQLREEDKVSEIKRRSLYGRAGAYRMKDYGVEYRTCSPVQYKNLTHTALMLTNTILSESIMFSASPIDNIWPDVVNGEAGHTPATEQKTWASYEEIENTLSSIQTFTTGGGITNANG